MLRRFLSGFAAFAAMLFILTSHANAQQRIALVIGNAAYPKGPIAHSLADGGLVAEASHAGGREDDADARLGHWTLHKHFVRDTIIEPGAARARRHSHDRHAQFCSQGRYVAR